MKRTAVARATILWPSRNETIARLDLKDGKKTIGPSAVPRHKHHLPGMIGTPQAAGLILATSGQAAKATRIWAPIQ